MSIDLQKIVADWSALGEGFNGLGLGIPLEEIRVVHLQHHAESFTTAEALREALDDQVTTARGWLMLTETLLHLPISEPLPPGNPLQGEWHVDGASWQLRYLGAADGWRLHQYVVSEPNAELTPTHLAEPISHLQADGTGSIRYSRLWALENDINDEPAPVPALSLLTGYGENK
ncbi:MAG: hypothetical protein WD397_11755 [Wenzhouxiangellaceae bacterium]